MDIIENEIGSHPYSKDEWPIVRRVIHATADFDFARQNMIVFHKNAISSGINALESGCNIIVDVNGVIGGLNKENLKEYGNKAICNISDPNILEQAKKLNKTPRPDLYANGCFRDEWWCGCNRQCSNCISGSDSNDKGKCNTTSSCGWDSSWFCVCSRIKRRTSDT